MEATCKTCPFWLGTPNRDGVSECRRPAPTGERYPDIFPDVHSDDWCGEHPLRQRDRIAAVAMQGLLASPHTPECWDAAKIAAFAYEAADAMLVACAAPPDASPGQGGAR